MSDNEKLLKEKFRSKQASTKGRVDKLGNPIEFRLTYDEWASLWIASGHLPGREYVLSRKDDTGHYEIGNVYVNHMLMNVTEASTANTDLDQRITQYCIDTGYKRRAVKSMIKRGLISF